jgi:hypothetical protein
MPIIVPMTPFLSVPSFQTGEAGRDPVAEVQQVKAAGIASPTLASQRAQSPSTQGVPDVVSNVSVVKKNTSTTATQLSVSFNRHPNDPYFTSAKVYMKYGTDAPTLVSEGHRSPIIFSQPRTHAPATVVVVSSGHWGSTPVEKSPVKAVSLR